MIVTSLSAAITETQHINQTMRSIYREHKYFVIGEQHLHCHSWVLLTGKQFSCFVRLPKNLSQRHRPCTESFGSCNTQIAILCCSRESDQNMQGVSEQPSKPTPALCSLNALPINYYTECILHSPLPSMSVCQAHWQTSSQAAGPALHPHPPWDTSNS